jgi:outer membrane receptor protein involved in Fe transport
MSSNTGIALTPLAAAVSAALAPGGAAKAQDDVVLEEIIVTATKREENLQEIPASIQAIPQTVLEKMGATGIADYSRFIPAVNVVSYDPGSTDIVFRGVQAGGTGGIAQSPSSMYIDEMPISSTGTQPEVRMYDIARIESLDGPQGTLYGGSAQSGTIRVITNQPDVSQFEASVDVTLRQGSDTGLSNDINAMVNLPFGEGKGAFRLSGFTATDAGFIDNVFGHTPDTHWGEPIPTWGVEDNAAVVEDEWNEVDYAGTRAALRWEFNDEWAATVSYMFQNMDGGGGNHFDPFVGDLQVVKFNDESRWDDWNLAALTIEGDLGWAQLVSATSYFDRELGNITDNTVYTKYYQTWACLYQWDPAVYTGYFVDPSTGAALFYPRYCFGPSSLSDTVTEQEWGQNIDRFSQELRITGGTDRADWIVGLYYERANDDYVSPWGRVTNFDYQDSVALQYWESIWGVGFAPDATYGWESNSRIEFEQTAVFGEFTWRLNDQWTANIGARWFDRTMDSEYWVNNPNTQLNGEFVSNGIAIAEGGTTDVVPKVNVSFQPTDNATVYALYTEGFRPGGTNRGRGNPILPVVFDADKLNNTEIGIKTMWANGRVRANLTWYDMEWEDFQMSVVDPSFLVGEVWQTVIANVGNASVTGLQTELDIAITEGLNFGMNVSSLDAEVTNNIDLDGNTSTVEITAGSRLPNSPEFKTSGWLDYTWNTNFIPGQAFARLQVSHTGNSLNQLTASQNFASGANPLVKTPSFTITDFRVGLAMDNGWQVDVFVNNLTDERAQYSEASGFFELPFSSVFFNDTATTEIYTNRPQEFGIRIAKRWSE